jgi:hypothetical protein
MGRTYKSFSEHLDEQFKDEDVVDTGLIKQLTEHLVGERIISKEFLNERSMSGLVTGVAGVLAIKGRSLLSKLKSEKDAFQKLNIVGEMVLLSTYGSVFSAAVSGKNTSILNKVKGATKIK